MRNEVCAGSPSAHPRFSDSLGRLRTQDRVVLKAKTFYSESIQSKSSTRERHVGKTQRKPNAHFQESSPSGLHRMCLNPPATSAITV